MNRSTSSRSRPMSRRQSSSIEIQSSKVDMRFMGPFADITARGLRAATLRNGGACDGIWAYGWNTVILGGGRTEVKSKSLDPWSQARPVSEASGRRVEGAGV